MQDNGSKAPLISVIIPSYNSERYLAEAIESVLGQHGFVEMAGVEIIVVDDASDDDPGRIVALFADRATVTLLRRQVRGGPGATRNTGIQVARGHYLAFLDADDLWTPDKLAIQMAAFDDDRDLDCVYGAVEHFVAPEYRGSLAMPVEDEAGVPIRAPGYVLGTMIITREAFMRVGLLPGTWMHGDFMEWYARALDMGVRMKMLPDLVMRRRIHGTNTALRDHSTQAPHYLASIRAVLERRKAQKTVGE